MRVESVGGESSTKSNNSNNKGPYHRSRLFLGAVSARVEKVHFFPAHKLFPETAESQNRVPPRIRDSRLDRG